MTKDTRNEIMWLTSDQCVCLFIPSACIIFLFSSVTESDHACGFLNMWDLTLHKTVRFPQGLAEALVSRSGSKFWPLFKVSVEWSGAVVECRTQDL